MHISGPNPSSTRRISIIGRVGSRSSRRTA